jgi:hypothetical protein
LHVNNRKGISKRVWSYRTVTCGIRKEARRYPYPEISSILKRQDKQKKGNMNCFTTVLLIVRLIKLTIVEYLHIMAFRPFHIVTLLIQKSISVSQVAITQII